MHNSGLSNSAKTCAQSLQNNSIQPHHVNLHNIIRLHIRREHSLWICKVTAEAGFCPQSHVLFNEPGVGLTWFACACYRITQCHCSCPHSPNIGTFWFYFSLGLSVSLREQKDLDSIFHQGGCWGFHFMCTFASRMEVFAIFQEYVPTWGICERLIWNRICQEALWLPCEGKL